MATTRTTKDKLNHLDLVYGQEAKYDGLQTRGNGQESLQVANNKQNDDSKVSSLFQQEYQLSDSNVPLHQNVGDVGNKSRSDFSKTKSHDVKADALQCSRLDSIRHGKPNRGSSFDEYSGAMSKDIDENALNTNQIHSDWKKNTATQTQILDHNKIYVNAEVHSKKMSENEQIIDNHSKIKTSNQEIIVSSETAHNNILLPHVDSQDLEDQAVRSSEQMRVSSSGSHYRSGKGSNNNSAIMQSHDDFAHDLSYRLPNPDHPFDYALHNTLETNCKQHLSIDKNVLRTNQKRFILPFREHHVKKVSSLEHMKNSIFHPIIASRTQSNASTAISDWDPEWTEQDSSYGAACPVCGCVPKSVRRAIEVTLISSFVLMTVLFIVSTSFRWHGNDTNNNTNLADDVDTSYVDDYYSTANQGYDDNYIAPSYDDDKFNSYADDLGDDNV